MLCINCKNEISDESNVCPNCGYNINSIPEQSIDKLENIKEKDNTNTQKTKKKKIIFLLVFLVVLITIVIIFLIKMLNNKANNYSGESSIETVSIVRDNSGIPKFIDGTFTDIKVKNESDAYKALESLKNELKFKNVKNEFNVESINKNGSITYYKFHQKYKDIEVYGNNLIISVNSQGKVLGMSGYYNPNIDVDINNHKTQEELEKIVKNDIDNTDAKIIESKENIYGNKLIYIIDIESDEEIKEYIIDANTGKIINSVELLDSVSYQASLNGINKIETVTIDYDNSILGTTYSLKDPTRNILIADGLGYTSGLLASFPLAVDPLIISGNIENNDFKYSGVNRNKSGLDGDTIAKMGVTALKNYEEIYDFYYNVLERNSYDNKGSNIVINVNMDVSEHGGAAWNGLTKQMEIGFRKDVSMAISKDVLTHEFTHGVVNNIVDFIKHPSDDELNQAFETGSLNEAIPDIFGCLIEGKNWIIGEDIEVIRNLENPESLKRASQKGGMYFFPDYYLNGRTVEQYISEYNKKNNKSAKTIYDIENGGGHRNATVPGHAAYLMYTNGAFESREQMAKVWYNALFLMSSTSKFEDAALAIVKSAKNMGLSGKSISVIEDAFMETKIFEDNRIDINGIVRSGTFELKDVTISFKNLSSEKADYNFTSDKDGKFTGKIQAGTYEVIVSKEGYKEYKKVVTLHGETTIDINLENSSNQSHNKTISCKGTNCHTIRIYFLDNLNGKMNENYEVYSVDDGTVLGTDILINTINKSFGDKIIQTDGQTFTISMGGFDVDFAWYYVGTDTKFDFNKPITEDIEIEMKLFDGAIDNSFLKDVYDIFNSNN